MYGNEVSFIAGQPSEIIIGTQIWATENLNVTTYRNGDPIPEVSDIFEWQTLTTGAWCYYPGTGGTYGKLYNWYAVNDPRAWHRKDGTYQVTQNGLF